MSNKPWVKWDPAAFLNGVVELGPNEGWVYTILLNLIYDADGPIKLSLDKLARRCRMRPSSVQAAMDRLVEAEKIEVRDGYVSNPRAQNVIESRRKLRRNSSEAAQAMWEKRKGEVNEIKEPDDAVALHPHSEHSAIKEIRDQISEEDRGAIAPLPPPEIEEALGDPPSDPSLTPEAALALWNEMAARTGLPKASMTESRRPKLRARLKAGTPAWKDALVEIETNPFFHGDSERGWRADIDFLLSPAKFQKVIEGGYRRNSTRPIPLGGTGPQRRDDAKSVRAAFEGIALASRQR